jgi:microcompartment protein CcmK/EutM
MNVVLGLGSAAAQSTRENKETIEAETIQLIDRSVLP